VTVLAPLLQAFFTERLIAQRRASGRTIACYRNTFRLLLGFATAKTGTKPSALDIGDLDAPLITAFLDHLEHERGNTVRTRNNRLARHPLTVRLRRAAPPRARSLHPARVGDPG
jgi:hypothetical protein